MLRATNTGMTAVIDPKGRIEAIAKPFTEAIVRAEVQGYDGATPFVRIGNGGALLFSVVLVIIAFVIGRRSR
jgi:apolipoprotein N-acyltransferase